VAAGFFFGAAEKVRNVLAIDVFFRGFRRIAVAGIFPAVHSTATVSKAVNLSCQKNPKC
jgi:hypothetical protein